MTVFVIRNSVWCYYIVLRLFLLSLCMQVGTTFTIVSTSSSYHTTTRNGKDSIQQYNHHHIYNKKNSNDNTQKLTQQSSSSSTLFFTTKRDHNNNNNNNIGTTTTTTTTTTTPNTDIMTTRMRPRIKITKSTQQLSMTSDPDPSVLISSKDDLTQQVAFFLSFVLLGVGTNLCIHLWQDVGQITLGIEFYEQIRTQIFPLLFGYIFLLVGISHFTFATNFVRIVPPYGTWGGLWIAPTPGRMFLKSNDEPITYEEYHCYWTGIVEGLGGLWLLLATYGTVDTPITIPATLLFWLVVGITPANLYMFTHNATPGGIIPQLDYPYGHIARFIIQCGLLSNFWIMSHP